jgi:hypothetical protein
MALWLVVVVCVLYECVGALGACITGWWLLESSWLLVVCRLRSHACCMRVVGYRRQAAIFQCSGRRGRLGGPSCGRASRMCVRVVLWLCLRLVTLLLFVLVCFWLWLRGRWGISTAGCLKCAGFQLFVAHVKRLCSRMPACAAAFAARAAGLRIACARCVGI